MKSCNGDCFNCEFNDCVLSEKECGKLEPLDSKTQKQKSARHEYYLKNKEKYIARAVEWRKKNKEKAYEIDKKYRANNQEQVKEGNHRRYLRWRERRECLKNDTDNSINVGTTA